MGFLGDLIDNVGTAFNLPEFGISEGQAGGTTVNTGRVKGSGAAANSPLINNAYATRQVSNGLDFGTGSAGTGQLQQAPQSGSYNAGGSGSGGAVTAQDLAFLNDNQGSLQNLLGRTNTAESQNIARVNEAYQNQLRQAEADKLKQYGAYDDKTTEANKGKLGAYDTLNKNAGNAYNSLAKIIGRAAGTGSSAFRELLPDVVGKDTSSKRSDITDTYGENLAGIKKARDQYDIDFAGVLEDLSNQRRNQEENVRSTIEGQRQDINSKLAANAAQMAQARGGGYAAVKAAQAPFQQNIENSRNAVEGFFNNFRAQYAPRTLVAANPDLAAYQVDRSEINAQNAGGDANNSYADLIRRRLQDQPLA